MKLTPLTLALIPALLASQVQAAPTTLGKGEGQLNIVAWAGYVERGETDKNYDWVTGFEKETGCKVNVKTAATSDEMVALMNEGGFDLVTASGDASLRLIAGGKVQALNLALIPSYGKIDPRLQNAPWHTVDGKHYGVPYQWGGNILMYNTKVFPKAPDSWNVVFEEQTLPDGKSNKGRVQAFDGPIHIADAALYLMSHQPALGIKDPYELNEDQYKAALDLLRQQRKLVGMRRPALPGEPVLKLGRQRHRLPLGGSPAPSSVGKYPAGARGRAAPGAYSARPRRASQISAAPASCSGSAGPSPAPIPSPRSNPPLRARKRKPRWKNTASI